ncbi:MAG: hypothetical protein OHK0052_01050 [Anaerolineales bacterium]
MNDELQSYILAWLQKATNDLKTASILLHAQDDDKPFDMVCFHCQQAAEKYLKGYLAFLNLNIPRTHNIAQLIELGAQNDPLLRAYLSADELTPYGVNIRYPDEISVPLESEAWQAYQRAIELKEYILAQIIF